LLAHEDGLGDIIWMELNEPVCHLHDMCQRANATV